MKKVIEILMERFEEQCEVVKVARQCKNMNRKHSETYYMFHNKMIEAIQFRDEIKNAIKILRNVR